MTRNRILKLIHKPILVLNGFLWLGLRYCILHPLFLSDVRLCLRLRLTSSQPGPTWIRQIRQIREEKAANEAPGGSGKSGKPQKRKKAANEAPRGSSRSFFQARASAPLRLPCLSQPQSFAQPLSFGAKLVPDWATGAQCETPTPKNIQCAAPTQTPAWALGHKNIRHNWRGPGLSSGFGPQKWELFSLKDSQPHKSYTSDLNTEIKNMK